MLKIDLHTHTNNVVKRYDSTINPKDLINKAAKLKFDVISITEHSAYKTISGTKYIKNPLATYQQYKDYAKKKGVILLPGVEIYVEGKDILLINFKGDYNKYKNIQDLEKLKKENVIVIAPHPYFIGGSCLKNKLEQNIKIFDAIEYSHFYLKHINPNKKAVEIAKKYKKPMIATSDAHFLFAFGRNYSFVDAEKKVDSILEAIRKNKIKIVTKPWDLPRFSFLFVYQIYSTTLEKLQ
ncbi:MAG: PHP domain-containing protein [Candidatus Nanoarchaeia archaeon]